MVKWNTGNEYIGNGKYATCHTATIAGKKVSIGKATITSGYAVTVNSSRVQTLASVKLAKEWAAENVK